MSTSFTHIDRKGKHIKMTDVTEKQISKRVAQAQGILAVSETLFGKLSDDENLCRSIFTTAKTAGILAAKKTGELIPLCHPLNIENSEIEIRLLAPNQICIQSTVCLSGKTGVEMEAMTAVSLAALTVYDMCKSVDKTIRIENIALYRKTGGKSGDFINSTVNWHPA